ncbi:MAG: divergent polysaccharide deacetylase family protein [Pseudomonadota bacterium]
MPTDLDAPLKPVRPRGDTTNKSPKRPLSPWGIATLSAVVACAAVAANAVFVVNADTRPEIALLQPEQPGDALASAESAQNIVPGSQNPLSTPENHGVEIVYGTDTNLTTGTTGSAAPQPAPSNAQFPGLTAPVPQPRAPLERELSPGGPKIITLVPQAPSVGQPLQLAHLPEDAATEENDEGLLLPRVTSDGRRPMDIYARPWSAGDGKRIAIVIGGIGLSQTSTQGALDTLPPDITLAFAPTGNSLDRWMQAARNKGHELLVQVPMEPFGYPDIDPGPQTLRLASSAETNRERLFESMGAVTNYTGVSNYLGARFLTNSTAIVPMFRELAGRGVLFFNDGSAKAPNIGADAQAVGLPYVEADIVIDASRSPAEIRARLKALEDLASARGQAVGSGSALGITIETVASWVNDAKKRGYEIVGVSALAQR